MRNNMLTFTFVQKPVTVTVSVKEMGCPFTPG